LLKGLYHLFPIFGFGSLDIGREYCKKRSVNFVKTLTGDSLRVIGLQDSFEQFASALHSGAGFLVLLGGCVKDLRTEGLELARSVGVGRAIDLSRQALEEGVIKQGPTSSNKSLEIVVSFGSL
jgi:hypothetical protein